MIFEIDPSSKRLVANILGGAAAGQYRCECTVCLNPVCTCATLHITLFPEKGPAETAAAPERIVSVDLKNKQIDSALQKSAPQQQLDFCNEVIGQMDEDDFDLLQSIHFHHKNVITETKTKPSQIEAKFEFDEIERGSGMLTYNGVLPYGDRISFAIDGVVHILFDHYCLRKTCDCTDACVEFVPVTADASLGEPALVAFIDYRSHEWKDAEGEPPLNDAEHLKEIAVSSVPDFYAKLAQRHAKLRSIYRHSYKRHAVASAELPKPRAVGRNDPCPCGSGKKYRKCCMT
jgi:hypothetical protein